MAKYSFSVGAVEAMRSIVSLPWGKSIEDTYRGGKLLAVGLPASKQGTLLDEEREVELDGPDRDTIKAALQFGLSKEAVQSSKYLYEVIVKLEFVSIPKPPTP